MILALARTEGITCGEWLRTWTRHYPGDTTAETREKYLRYCKFFAAAHENVPLAEVTPLMAQAWTLKRPMDVRYLSICWRRALLAGLVPTNPWRYVERPPHKRQERVPPTQEQLDAAVARCRSLAASGTAWSTSYLWDAFAEMILFAAYTGARLGGCASLRMKHVDLINNRVTLHEKGGKVRTAALLGPSREAIARAMWQHRPHNRQGYVFLTGTAKPITRDWVSGRWGKVRGDFPFGFHCLRHFAATWMLERGATPSDVAQQLGHVDRLGRPYADLIYRVYSHPVPEDALARLEALGG